MQVDLTPQILMEVAGRTLEDTAFVLVDAAEDEKFSGAVVHAALEFTGTEKGTLTVASSNPFAVYMAANLMGLEMNAPGIADLGSEALGELVNIMAGALTERLFGTNQLCQIGIPVTSTVSPDAHQSELEASTCWVSLLGDDEHRIDVFVELGL